MGADATPSTPRPVVHVDPAGGRNRRGLRDQTMCKSLPWYPLLSLLWWAAAGCATAPPPAPPAWIPLFDGATTSGWVATSHGMAGVVEVEDGELRLHAGDSVSGLRYVGDLEALLPPAWEEYELHLEARRVSGQDFFCGLTFPVGRDGTVSLICGGWGGAVVGISCLDGLDASENESTLYHRFEVGRWYDILVRVTASRIQCFLDEEPVIDIEREGHREFAVRAEMDGFQPLGLGTFQTLGAFRKVEVRTLGPGSELAPSPPGRPRGE